MTPSPERASTQGKLSPSGDVGLSLNGNTTLNCSTTGRGSCQQRRPGAAADIGCVVKSGYLAPGPVQ